MNCEKKIIVNLESEKPHSNKKNYYKNTNYQNTALYF